MPNFTYQAITLDGRRLRGVVQAATEELASETLSERGLTVVALQEQAASKLTLSLHLFKHIKVRDLVILTRQLAVLLSANVPVVQSLRVLTEQTVNKNLKVIVSEIADDVDGGAKLSAAMARHPEAFDHFFVNVVHSGETSGKLDETLDYLAEQLEKDYDLMSRIRGAMIYPAFIFCGLIAVGILMMVYVVPQITGILLQSNVELPMATKIIIAASNFLVGFWWLIPLAAVGVVTGVRLWGKTPTGRYLMDYAKLKVPIFGILYKKVSIVRMTRSLGTLIIGGVSLPRSLQITAEVVGNDVYRRLIEATIKAVEDGKPIASVMLKSPVVPLMVSQMLNVGESTGRTDQVLAKMTDFYGREIDNLVRNLVSLIEPVILVVMGVAVGLMVAAVILPLYSLSGAIG